MKFQIDFECPELEHRIEHPSNIFLIGSCFAENITTYLQDLKYNVHSNPHGILYNAQSISNSIQRILTKQAYTAADLVERDGLLHCFDFHSSYSGTNEVTVLENMNQSIKKAYNFLEKAQFVIISLGTSYVYKHLERDIYVGNNHKFPTADFSKELLSATRNKDCLRQIIEGVRNINEQVQFIFTVSPVRHFRDGVVENNLSKSNLISAVHYLLGEGYYFPAYELVIDVLRDYRFYKKDLVHPNGQAVEFIWQVFVDKCLSNKDTELRKRLSQLRNNINHKPFHGNSKTHQLFLVSIEEEIEKLKEEYPYLEF